MPSAEVRLRNAEKSDVAEIASVYLASRKLLSGYAPLMHTDDAVFNWIDENLIPGGITLALLNQKITGLCAASQRDHIGWIDQLYIHPQYLRQGVGSALLMHAIERLPSPIRLYTFQANVASRLFYERHGFVAIAFTDGAGNEEGAPDVLYERALKK